MISSGGISHSATRSGLSFAIQEPMRSQFVIASVPWPKLTFQLSTLSCAVVDVDGALTFMVTFLVVAAPLLSVTVRYVRYDPGPYACVGFGSVDVALSPKFQ